MSRLYTIPLAMLVAAALFWAPAAAPRSKPPRIVSALMVDANRDARADSVRLTYSVPVRHALDRDGRYPFAVVGYRIRAVGAAKGRTVIILLAEKKKPDSAARPAIRYRRTRSKPVVARAGAQATAQLFRATRPHRRTLPLPTTTAATTGATAVDSDHDGTPDEQDCAPKDPAIHPGAPDLPDLAFVDSNCDGIDGTEADAIFVSAKGSDTNPGTKERPKREVQAAVDAAAGRGKVVLVAFGQYGHVRVGTDGIGIYGGYDPTSWKRLDRYPGGLPLILGSPEGVFVSGAKDVVLQYLEIRSMNGTLNLAGTGYGIRAKNGAGLIVQRVVVRGGDGAAGAAGADGQTGASGGSGAAGGQGACDKVGLGSRGRGGEGGSSPAGLPGGDGGGGGWQDFGSFPTPGPRHSAERGNEGQIGTPGGAPGSNGNPGKAGGRGESGDNGAPGSGGAGATASAGSANAFWIGQGGGTGGLGSPGNGGGGGGGGGAQIGALVKDGGGNGGGGGGGGGRGGTGGGGGGAGGGSFGIYLFRAAVVVQDSSIAAGKGGAGGSGGSGGFGGPGGAGGKGGAACTSEVGRGGDGGLGGAGGRGGGGGGGAGGPSVGIFRLDGSTATLKGVTSVTNDTPSGGGPGGSGGPGGTGTAGARGIATPVYP